MAPRSREVDPSQPWHLLHILRGHTSDVKAVWAGSVDENGTTDAPATELVFSASRDETVRSWYRKHRLEDNFDEHAGPSSFRKGATYQGQRYQNAVAYMPPSKSNPSGLTVVGGLDSRILAFEARADYSDKPRSSPLQILNDHHDNVCHLSVEAASDPNLESTLLISASWDGTSRVWAWQEDDRKWSLMHILKGHERAVWAAEVVSNRKGEERYLTASADLSVRLWDGDCLARIYLGHADVVRSIVLLHPSSTFDEPSDEVRLWSTSSPPPFLNQEALFGTTSNDGTLRVWSLDERRFPHDDPRRGSEALRVLSVDDGAGDILYDSCCVGAITSTSPVPVGLRVVATCGEGGVVRGWNIDLAKVTFELEQPVTSAWGIACLPASGDLVTADADGLVRVYTQRILPRKATQERNADVVEQVDEAERARHEEMCREVSAKRRKSRVRADVVAQESGALSSTAGENGRPVHTDGRSYDAILKIDVSDDAEPLSLPMNARDDPRERAKHFIAEHNLPEVYEDQIVAFIEQVGPK